MKSYINLEVGKSKPQRILSIGGLWNDYGMKGFITDLQEDDNKLEVSVQFPEYSETFIVNSFYPAKTIPFDEIYHD